MNRQEIGKKVVQTAEETLAARGYVAPIDVFMGCRMLLPAQVEDWRRGRIHSLERVMRGNLSQFSVVLRTFRQWDVAKGLRPSETSYRRHTRGSKPELRFSASGHPTLDKTYRTHYVSGAPGQGKAAAGGLLAK